mmetsp:Transcript_24193/g.37470  ORF Transcript_24193/g.37470 Transcript_24193/m.37470 type:complete len:298 (-) Transcript_24193:24-917(-)
MSAAGEVLAENNRGGCCSRLRHECSPGARFFDPAEPSGDIIDVENSFAPERKFQGTVVIRLIFMSITIATFCSQLLFYGEMDRTLYFFFYLTNWTFTLNIAYFASAIYITIKRSTLAQPDPCNNLEEESQRYPFSVRLVWVLYSIAAPAGIAVSILYWALDYKHGISLLDLRSCMLHGGVAALVLLDGNVVASVPLRAKNILSLTIFLSTFVTWSIIHDYSGIGDGDVPNEGDEIWQDSLYNVLSWHTNFGLAAIVAFFAVFLLNPICFSICWCLSLLRRKVVKGGNVSETAVSASV